MSKLEEELKAAFAEESQAYTKYVSFAKKAENEGYKQISKLFRAAAENELIQARNHLRALDLVKTTRENILTSLNSKIYEVEEMYPAMIETAKGYNNKWAIKSLCYAKEAGKVLSKLLKKKLKDMENNGEVDYYLCKVCGFIVENELPEKCPVCGSRKETFKKIE